MSPNHQELLHALIGVRQLASELHPNSVKLLVGNIGLLSCGVGACLEARVNDANNNNNNNDDSVGSSSSGSGSSGDSERSSGPDSSIRRQAVRDGELVPWQIALPLHLVQIELLTLMPPHLSADWRVLKSGLEEVLRNLEQLRHLRQIFEDQKPHPQPPATLPSLADFKALAQAYAQSLWLQLGPVLLSVCRCGGGEVEPNVDFFGPCDTPGPAVAPRELFAPDAALLSELILWQGEEVALVFVMVLWAVYG